MAYATRVRKRWFSRRALLLHLEVAIVAPGCALAGWWQATRALAGNGLSWVYSVEWPAFGLLAIVAWWYLVHEDPEAYRARKQDLSAGGEEVSIAVVTSEPGPTKMVTVEAPTARLAKILAALVGVQFLLGMLVLIFVPVGRPSGLLPDGGVALYLAHAILGLPLAFGAMALLSRSGTSRLSRVTAWTGGVGVAVAGLGGVMTESQPLRLVGMGVMFIGTVVAAFGYLVPTLERLS